MSAYVELYIDQGATFSSVITMVDDLTNSAVNVSGYSAQSQIRRSPYSANITANLVCTISDAANGQITLSLDSANTSNIQSGRYLFDVLVTDTNDVVTRILEGTMTVTPQITR